jgi:hypothetical protein
MTSNVLLRLEHVPRHWYEGGDRWVVCMWRRRADGAAHARIRLPYAVCPSEAAASLIIEATRAYQEASVAAGLGDPLDAIAATYGALDSEKEVGRT